MPHLDNMHLNEDGSIKPFDMFRLLMSLPWRFIAALFFTVVFAFVLIFNIVAFLFVRMGFANDFEIYISLMKKVFNFDYYYT